MVKFWAQNSAVFAGGFQLFYFRELGLEVYYRYVCSTLLNIFNRYTSGRHLNAALLRAATGCDKRPLLIAFADCGRLAHVNCGLRRVTLSSQFTVAKYGFVIVAGQPA